ncbi:hypothetical protein GGP41_006310 [Bipolaris sorokiniana]|uniref:Uncharacterized protein n=1 Tax=Cochliobolus sativus TaxID=45130 RepID=A0A8H6DWV4_COCSA|nr:hypothetical protein GGP41_006310 [Bipolaris sorokiniana]
MAPGLLAKSGQSTTSTPKPSASSAIPATLSNRENNSALLHRSLTEHPHRVTYASGCYLTLSDGRKILDACGGAAVAVLGHGNQEVTAATVAQMNKVSYVHTGFYTTSSAEDLAECILSGSKNHGLEKAYFVGSGSEANEAAMKLARQYFWEQKQTQRTHFVSRRLAYHGNTIASMSLSTNISRKVPYDGAITLPSVSYVSPAYPYRSPLKDDSEEAHVAYLVEELNAEFQRIGPHNVIAFFAETVVGATSGCVAPPNGYFAAVQKLCDSYGILLILDEVMCGMGRTGTYFAFEQENILPDIVTIGKGLGGGFAPIAGVLISKKVMDVLRRGTASFNHGHTYQAHPVSCATALAVQQIIQRDQLVQRCAEMGLLLGNLLRHAFQGRRFVGDIRGRGLFYALEFVAERSSKTRLRPSLRFASRVQRLAFEKGVAVYPGPMNSEGTESDHILLAPPYNISVDELEKVVNVLKEAYCEVDKEVELLYIQE